MRSSPCWDMVQNRRSHTRFFPEMARRSIENVCNFSISSRACTNIWQDLEWDDHSSNSALKYSTIFPVSGPPRSTASHRDLHALLCKVARSRLTTYFVGKPNLEIEGRISIEEEDHKVYGWEDGPCPVPSGTLSQWSTLKDARNHTQRLHVASTLSLKSSLEILRVFESIFFYAVLPTPPPLIALE